jgi:hypothetical protein
MRVLWFRIVFFASLQCTVRRQLVRQTLEPNASHRGAQGSGSPPSSHLIFGGAREGNALLRIEHHALGRSAILHCMHPIAIHVHPIRGILLLRAPQGGKTRQS